MNPEHSSGEEDLACVGGRVDSAEGRDDATQVLLEAASQSLVHGAGHFIVQLDQSPEVVMMDEDRDDEYPDAARGIADEEDAGDEEDVPLNMEASTLECTEGEKGGEGRPFHCPACKQDIQGDVQAIVEHLYQHSKVLARVCRECGLKTRSANAMVRHVAQHAHSKASMPNLGAYLDDLQRLFVCVICGNRYKFCGHAKTHLYLHMAEKRYQCSICRAFFTRNNALRKHMWGSHGRLLPSDQLQEEGAELNEGSAATELNGEKAECSSSATNTFRDGGTSGKEPLKTKVIRCLICGRPFLSDRTLEKHMSTHMKLEVLHSCDFCPKKFTSRSYLRKHRSTLHGIRDTGVNKHFTCSVCGFFFVGTSFFASHLLQHLDNKEQRPEQPSTASREDHAYTREVQAEAGNTTGPGVSLSRPVPGQKRSTSSHRESPVAGSSRGAVSLLTGKKYKVASQSPIGGKGAKSASVPQSSRLTPVEIFACSNCQQTFTDESKYHNHLAAHEKRPLISCYHCSEKFHTKADLESHLANFFSSTTPEAREVLTAGEKTLADGSGSAGEEEEDASPASTVQLEEVTGYCKSCKVAFCSVEFLNMHMSTVHANVPTYTLVQMADASIQGRAVVTAHFST